uniref:MYND-type domain-containing protein n=1 Tax=Compsopogon caeruleus TaxID=31354 RepID=A0A6T6B3W4_9RHOD|mmetsp:Transcript_13453/g.27458  ORF Transcript_13453/g.27458 Transcript_13453/m.27458 type:complete len:349 (+) Transcript_13453:2-1048(+)
MGDENSRVVRPYLILVMELYPRGCVIRNRYAKPAGSYPDPQAILNLILDEILDPMADNPQNRPMQVAFVDSNLTDALRPVLKTLEIETTSLSRADGVSEFLQAFSQRIVEKENAAISDSSNHPGLLSVPLVTASLVHRVMTACLNMQERQPWKIIPENVGLFCYYSGERVVVTVLGSAGRSQGFAVTRSPRAAKHKYRKAMGLDLTDYGPTMRMLCGSCGTEPEAGSNSHRCAGCRSIFYCNENCQSRDWTAMHWNECDKLKRGDLDFVSRACWALRELVVLFMEESAVPFDDLDALEKYNWPTGEPPQSHLIPFVNITNLGFEPRIERPTPEELTMIRCIADGISEL